MQEESQEKSFIVDYEILFYTNPFQTFLFLNFPDQLPQHQGPLNFSIFP